MLNMLNNVLALLMIKIFIDLLGPKGPTGKFIIGEKIQ
jgi:hypothetical protein